MSQNIIFIGGSGMGKGKIGDAIPKGKAQVVEPYRARKDGAREGERYFISPDMLSELLRLNRALSGAPLLQYDSDIGNVSPYGGGSKCFRAWLEIYEGASFFMVRDTAQVLLHNELNSPAIRKLEIFGPVLSAILRSPAKDVIPYFQNSSTVFILLNPLAVPITKIDAADIAKCQFAEAGWNWEKVQIERNKIVKDGDAMPDDVAVRMALLPNEAEAWQNLTALAVENPKTFAFIDCTKWSFFECRTLKSECSREDAVKHLLECIREQTPDLHALFKQLFGGD